MPLVAKQQPSSRWAGSSRSKRAPPLVSGRALPEVPATHRTVFQLVPFGVVPVNSRLLCEMSQPAVSLPLGMDNLAQNAAFPSYRISANSLPPSPVPKPMERADAPPPQEVSRRRNPNANRRFAPALC